MTYLLDGIYAIEVPEEFCHAEIKVINEVSFLTTTSMSVYSTNHSQLQLPPGSYEILFTTKKCSKEQAKSVIDGSVIYELMDVSDYNVVLNHLLSQRNLDPEKNYILIKREV